MSVTRCILASAHQRSRLFRCCAAPVKLSAQAAMNFAESSRGQMSKPKLMRTAEFAFATLENHFEPWRRRLLCPRHDQRVSEIGEGSFEPALGAQAAVSPVSRGVIPFPAFSLVF